MLGTKDSSKTRNVAERKIPTDFLHVNEFHNVRVVVAIPFYDYSTIVETTTVFPNQKTGSISDIGSLLRTWNFNYSNDSEYCLRTCRETHSCRLAHVLSFTFH